MAELIITEKPSSARKIAEALGDGRPVQKKSKRASYFEISHGGKDIIVTSAVGHLYGLVEKNKGQWKYPVFDIEWEESYKSSKELKYVKDYLDMIISLAKGAKEFTVACDYDIEGEVIGYNVIRFACKKKDANRMKFSTLTKADLVESYEQKIPHLDWGQAFAGETRHMLDWYYGINLSRALTASVKAAGSFKILSSGRVQGPTLKLLVDREREIASFKPEPYSQIKLVGDFKSERIDAEHIKDRIFDQAEAERIMGQLKGAKNALVDDIKRIRRSQSPPVPFDLTTLQSESYNQFKITPKETLEIAQSLYLAGVTSYPRTSSQQLDSKLGFRNILTQLSKQPAYAELSRKLLLLDKLKPNNGKKSDPAHPAIYPTGLVPGEQTIKEKKVYDLIVKRFLATFAEPAVRETMEVKLKVRSEVFITKGTRTVEEKWHVFYKPYVKLEEVSLPALQVSDNIDIKSIMKIDKMTEPPNRYNQSSIIKELEKRNLGTKATRADILDRLFQRGYIEGIQIKVLRLGMETTSILERYVPVIVDEKLTAHFESEMELIRADKMEQETVLKEARNTLTPILKELHQKEKAIGQEILKSLQETRESQNRIGSCLACKDGSLQLKKGKFGLFIACSKYPACTATFKIPQGVVVKGTAKSCERCEHPIVEVRSKGRRPQQHCINPACPSKNGNSSPQASERSSDKPAEADTSKETADVRSKKGRKTAKTQNLASKKATETAVGSLGEPTSGASGLICPKCGKQMIKRQSFYGEFWGCSGFPACRYTQNIILPAADTKTK